MNEYKPKSRYGYLLELFDCFSTIQLKIYYNNCEDQDEEERRAMATIIHSRTGEIL